MSNYRQDTREAIRDLFDPALAKSSKEDVCATPLDLTDPFGHKRMIKKGQRFVTVSGRVTTPAPHIDLSTSRKLMNTQKRIEKWLYDNAVDEMKTRNNSMADITLKSLDLKNLSPSDRDDMNAYLWSMVLYLSELGVTKITQNGFRKSIKLEIND